MSAGATVRIASMLALPQTPQLAEAIRHARTSVGVYYDPISKVYKKGGRGAPEALAQAAAAAAEAKKQSPGRKRTIKEILGSW